MANKFQTNGLTYLSSTDVKVFPCAYRGYEGDNRNIFDPEARGMTERNYSNIYSKLGESKESFVISYKNNTLKCVIDGYYFELSNLEPSDFLDQAGGKINKLIIRKIQVDLGSAPNSQSYKTTILGSFNSDTDLYLDTKMSDQKYYFTGIALVSEDYNNTNYTAELAPFKAVKNEGEIYEAQLDWSKRRVTDVIDVGSELSSLRMLGDIVGVTSQACTASAQYAVALGKTTEATAEATTALGDHTKASATAALAVGSYTESKHANAIAAGNNTKTSRANQVVIGQYNKDDTNALLIIGNGTTSSRKNKLTVSKDGDIWATGKVEIEGGLIKATTKTTNTLQLGGTGENNSGDIHVYGKSDAEVFTVSNTGETYIEDKTVINNYIDIKNKTVESEDIKPGLTVQGQIKAENGKDNTLTLGSATSGDYGAITMYGVGTTPVFSVTNTGVVTASSNLTIGGQTQLNGSLTVADGQATLLGAGLTVKGATALQSTLTVTGNTTLNNPLTVATDKATTLGGTLTVAKATQLNDSLTVADGKNTILGGALSVKKNASITGAINAASSVTITGDLTANGSTLINNALTVSNATTLNGTLTVTNATQLNDNLTVASGKNTTLGGALTVQGSTSLADALTVADGKNTTLGGTLTVTGETTVENSLSIAQDITVGGAATITGNISGGSYTTSGTITASSFNATSDKRLKTNIKPYKAEKSILDLPIVEYDFIESGEHHIGCLAQDLQEICPELVHERDGYLTIEESKLVYLLINEFKELKAEIKTLKGE